MFYYFEKILSLFLSKLSIIGFYFGLLTIAYKCRVYRVNFLRKRNVLNARQVLIDDIDEYLREVNYKSKELDFFICHNEYNIVGPNCPVELCYNRSNLVYTKIRKNYPINDGSILFLNGTQIESGFDIDELLKFSHVITSDSGIAGVKVKKSLTHGLYGFDLSLIKIIRIILDNNPSAKINCIGFDFYLSSKLYPDGYLTYVSSQGAINKYKLRRSLSSHDIFSNYLLLKHFVCNFNVNFLCGALEKYRFPSIHDYIKEVKI